MLKYHAFLRTWEQSIIGMLSIIPQKQKCPALCARAIQLPKRRDPLRLQAVNYKYEQVQCAYDSKVQLPTRNMGGYIVSCITNSVEFDQSRSHPRTTFQIVLSYQRFRVRVTKTRCAISICASRTHGLLLLGLIIASRFNHSFIDHMYKNNYLKQWMT